MKSKQELRIRKQHRREIMNALSLLTQLGLTMTASVLVGIVAGRFLDGRLGTSPWFLLCLTVLGACAALKTMYDAVMRNIGNIEKDDGEK